MKPNFQEIIYFSAPHPAKIFILYAYDSPLTSLTSLNVSYFHLHHTRHNKLFTLKNEKMKNIFSFSENDIFFLLSKQKKNSIALGSHHFNTVIINTHSVFEHVFQPNKQKIKSCHWSEIEINYDVITQNLTIKKF